MSVIGGTGPQGSGLGYRLARAGHRIILGSRDPQRAATVARQLTDRLGRRAGSVSGASNRAAVEASDMAIVAVPYAAQRLTIEEIAPALTGKVLISCVNPLGFDAVGPHGLDLPDGSAAEELQRCVRHATVVAAFHHLSASTLLGEAPLIDEDVLVCGDDPEAVAAVCELARAISGRPGVAGGALRLARQLEPLTAVLISINKAYRAHSGLRITGLPSGR
ncbi:NADPH-dependent F420 reductase [Nocardioides sp. AE5]|uniref:NADPH-dependent F420 reductase n=1 Tax=Nocardioides sp. AE5 TaxID=2962573 RepID=UPI002880CB95|nr:NADPH-dependent F420 reductase [Nocardioides sp. AE5]MDT0202491.1 NADPH-dependent F420 reductase [Nocardioides sp. AE5]